MPPVLLGIGVLVGTLVGVGVPVAGLLGVGVPVVGAIDGVLLTLPEGVPVAGVGLAGLGATLELLGVVVVAGVVVVVVVFVVALLVLAGPPPAPVRFESESSCATSPEQATAPNARTKADVCTKAGRMFSPDGMCIESNMLRNGELDH